MTQEQKQTFWEFIRYCVVGGTAFLCETAAHFGRLGRKVTLVEMREDIALDADVSDI